MSPAPEPIRLLFVCTANICRSPTAEIVARSRFGEEHQLFRSAGFMESGRACPPLLVETLRERGLDASGHRSYQLDEASLSAADLVLTMEGEHVQRATIQQRTSFGKIVPLREAASAVEQAGRPLTVAGIIESVNATRDPSSYLSSRWDVDDPFGGKARDYRRAVDEIASLVDVVIGGLVRASA